MTSLSTQCEVVSVGRGKRQNGRRIVTNSSRDVQQEELNEREATSVMVEALDRLGHSET